MMLMVFIIKNYNYLPYGVSVMMLMHFIIKNCNYLPSGVSVMMLMHFIIWSSKAAGDVAPARASLISCQVPAHSVVGSFVEKLTE